MNRNDTLNNHAPILLFEDNPAHTELILRGIEAGTGNQPGHPCYRWGAGTGLPVSTW